MYICRVKVSAVYDWPTIGLGPNLDLAGSEAIYFSPHKLISCLGFVLPMLCFDLLGPVIIDLVSGTWPTAGIGSDLDLDLTASGDLLFIPCQSLLSSNLVTGT